VELLYLSEPGESPVASHPRTLVFVGKNGALTVVERYVGLDATRPYLTNAVTEIVLQENAILDHCKVQAEGAAGHHVANTQVVLQRSGSFTSQYVSLGGALTRNEVRVRFDGEGAVATVNGLYVARGKQHMDNFTVIDHAVPNCESHELYKGILDGQAHGVFNGKIFVRQDAQKTNAKQTNKVLLLSDGAVINTKPQLEIFADDVKCTHGATVGQLDEAQLFYLRARGIPEAEARRILTFAFANDLVGRIRAQGLREELEARLLAD
jgi:Fe-S cluster assembly protein SufD